MHLNLRDFHPFLEKKKKYEEPNINIRVGGSQPVFTCSKLTIETLEQSVKYVQS